MTRGVWAGLVACAVGVGCVGPQYYSPPPEQLPPIADVGGTAVQLTDQRPEWEKKPFTGVVCLYHLGKAHPSAWAQLAEEANAAVAAMPQKPQRVEVAVTSFRLVRAGDTAPRFRDWSAGPSANPGARTQEMIRANGEERERRLAQNGSVSGSAPSRATGDHVGTDVEVAFASQDDPRRMLRDHPVGASCAIRATVRLVFPDGREQTVDVKTIARGANETGTAYWGEALDFAAKAAVHDFGRQFRAAVGLPADG